MILLLVLLQKVIRIFFGVNDFKSADVSEAEVKYALKLMLDRGLVFDVTAKSKDTKVGQLTWEGQNYYEDEWNRK